MRRQLTTRLGVAAMADSSTKKAVLESAGWTNYWKSVLCVGLPFILLYQVTDYFIFAQSEATSECRIPGGLS
jgi:hypothetical protein